ncbi:hypothetical protein ES332_A12G025500v1 [Gossypium tomentosum]|uniref:Uncharacterized protein n=1 Tax=Gossypium tomentosum TaxID=34277 RepID=A0A5D2MSU9_GOSTO|nr:hypothetical protein ES332_A12G025500v1 [Gossypium tomentosum]
MRCVWISPQPLMNRIGKHGWPSFLLIIVNPDVKRLAIGFWALWFNRNSIYHEGAGKSAHGVISFIKAYITEMDRLENTTSTMQFSVDVLKLNFDASFQQDTNRSVSGIIVRNAKD